MITRLAPVLLIPLVLMLAACGDGTTPGGAPSGPTDAQSPTPTEVENEPTDANPDDFLIRGGIDVLDSDGMWMAQYAFFADDSKQVRCDIFLFSGDAPVASCGAQLGSEGAVTYALPADASCDYSGSNPFDGYTVALNNKGLYPKVAGYSGCNDPANAPYKNELVQVLPDNATLTVDPFVCSVSAATVACQMPSANAYFNYSLDAVSFEG
jgi:hypothetical protein